MAFLAHAANAEPAAPAGGDTKSAFDKAIGVYFGKMLPYEVYGVRDVYSFWGMRYSHKFYDIEPEYSIKMINAKSVNFYTASASLSSHEKLEDWTFIPFFGADMHYYRGHTKTKRLPYWTTSFGFHVGFSPVIEITDRISLRVDFKFNFNPGMQLDVDGGLQCGFTF